MLLHQQPSNKIKLTSAHFSDSSTVTKVGETSARRSTSPARRA
jgi:hypothetical protein